MKKCLVFLVFCNVLICFAQKNYDSKLENKLRVNILNPGVDYEIRLASKTTLSLGGGIGYTGNYEELTVVAENGFNYDISPFADTQLKYFYNRNKRAQKGLVVQNNSGNYFSLRFLTRFQSIDSNFIRTDNIDFFVGPTWGFQRSYGSLHLLIDFGPQYYFDSLGNEGFFPIMAQVNLGWTLN